GKSFDLTRSELWGERVCPRVVFQNRRMGTLRTLPVIRADSLGQKTPSDVLDLFAKGSIVLKLNQLPIFLEITTQRKGALLI
ncbi:MAG: hypothetical protein ACI87E_002992, partial [Mariniblastus sp.]